MDRIAHSILERDVEIPADGGLLQGTLAVPEDAAGLVLFCHGSGSSRWSPRHRRMAATFHAAGLATLRIDLLSEREEAVDRYTACFRFDVGRLARRLVAAVDWLAHEPDAEGLAIGCFGAGTGVAAALIAAAERPERIGAVVSRSGRPDLAGDALAHLVTPTLLIVGGGDAPVLELNRRAVAAMGCPVELEVIPGAIQPFDEPGALERVCGLAADWFHRHLAPPQGSALGDPVAIYEQAWEGAPARVGWS